jgi:5-formyltetrahydrofolate cyclo-ligase
VPGTTPTKPALRAKHQAARAERSEVDQDRLARGLRDQLLALPELANADRVAAFVSQDGEPGTRPLIDALHDRGIEVLLPVLLGDFDLDWGPYEPGQQEPGRFGLLVPTTPALGPEAVASAQVVVCPGVAVDRSGNRLGRGGGSYDRALARCGGDVLRVQLVYDDEVVDAVPAEKHDQRVQVIVTPSTTLRVRAQGQSDG